MIYNMYVPLLWPNLVCFGTHVLGLVSSVLCVMFFFFLCLIHFVQEFEFLCFFGCLIFFFGSLFWVVLESNQDFGLVYSGTKNFGSTRSGQVKKQSGQMVLYCVCFAIFVKGFLGLRVCLAHTHLTYFG
jgi:hypothetical protein